MKNHLILAGTIAVLGLPLLVYGCSCAVFPDPLTAMEEADVVFTGKIIHIDEPSEGPVMSSMDPRFVEFEVGRSFKGPLAPTIVLQTARESASCGYPFVEGETYLVYANEFENKLHAGLCSRTTRLADAGEDLAALGQGQVPETGPPPSTPPRPNFIWAVLIGTAVGLWFAFRHPNRAS